MKTNNGKKPTRTFATAVGRALRRAGQVARKTARAHGTPVYIWQDGKVVAEKPCSRTPRRHGCSDASAKSNESHRTGNAG